MGKNWKLESGTGLLLVGKELYGAAGQNSMELLERAAWAGDDLRSYWTGESGTGLLDRRELDRTSGWESAGQGCWREESWTGERAS
jgi:hypothetical protein